VTKALERFIARSAGARRATVVELRPLPGGAIQDNRLLTVDIEGGPHAGRLHAVLRTDAPSAVAVSHTRAHEFALLRAAFAAGVAVPEPLWLCDDPAVLGRLFFVMRRVGGVAAGHRVVKEVAAAGNGDPLAARLGEEMAKIHAIVPPRPDLTFLASPEPSPALHAVMAFRRYLDKHRTPMPALEWGLRWLERHAPPKGPLVLCHHDFRTGNYLVDGGRLAGILDWEFAGWSDPHEDIGWFCAKCWRFGQADKEAGGIGAREAFYAAYEEASGRRIDRQAVMYWEVMAHVRWAVIAVQQAERHVSGEESSLELALTAHVVPELELEILRTTEESS
jgi:aminoglycoside phosphotransferase (APT) family kinase protein